MSTESVLLCVIIILALLVLYLWGQIRELRRDQDADAFYFDWWMRSLENRKANRVDEPVPDEDDYS